MAVGGDVHLEKSGSPKLSIRSRGHGTQHYSVRVTNARDGDGADARCFVVRNEDHGRDEIILDAAGNVAFSGDVVLSGADCAEDFEVVCADDVAPGDVMVIDEGGRLCASSRMYDTRVAGIVAGAGEFRPGMVLGRKAGDGAEGRVPIALVGRTNCRVDAEYGAVRVGDLLTTSPTRGHAMRAGDPLRAFGAVVGKAMVAITEGRSLIPVLIALQ
ncbi:hypothetical protein [Gordonia rhizosphera]|uniref:hypothetical protein n=1 Tax=Gordonia rhizosphera TaxID=83341 RepID=UPI001C3F456A|nr:hypothetical protein [Gordonia rhizosphera]